MPEFSRDGVPLRGAARMGAGPGRPKGSVARHPSIQRKFAEAILGVPGTQEYIDTITAVRKQLLAGILPPQVVTLLMHYFVGKPVEHIEVKDTTDALDNLSEAELRQQALDLAQAILEQKQQYAERTNESTDDITH